MPLTGKLPFSHSTSTATGRSASTTASPLPLATSTALRTATTVRGYDSSGTALPGWPVSVTGSSCGVTADSEGHVWASTESNVGAGSSTRRRALDRLVQPQPRHGDWVVRDRDRLLERGHLHFGVHDIRHRAGVPLLQGDQLHDLRTNGQQPLQKAPIAVNGVNHRLYVGSESTQRSAGDEHDHRQRGGDDPVGGPAEPSRSMKGKTPSTPLLTDKNRSAGDPPRRRAEGDDRRTQ